MPVLVVLLIAFVVVFLVALLFPLGLFIRYRVATSRRRPRRSLVTMNLAGFWVSAIILTGVASVMTLWEAKALLYVGSGFLVGGALGGLGLAASTWEDDAKGTYVTAHRGVILLVSLVVVGRIAYGLWRAWSLWPGDDGEGGWLAAAGVSGSLAAGAILIGYSLVWWGGVRYRIRRQQ